MLEAAAMFSGGDYLDDVYEGNFKDKDDELVAYIKQFWIDSFDEEV